MTRAVYVDHKPLEPGDIKTIISDWELGLAIGSFRIPVPVNDPEALRNLAALMDRLALAAQAVRDAAGNRFAHLAATENDRADRAAILFCFCQNLGRTDLTHRPEAPCIPVTARPCPECNGFGIQRGCEACHSTGLAELTTDAAVLGPMPPNQETAMGKFLSVITNPDTAKERL